MPHRFENIIVHCSTHLRFMDIVIQAPSFILYGFENLLKALFGRDMRTCNDQSVLVQNIRYGLNQMAFTYV